jgi:predicted anti-sigma-YlaC factor YlaD
MRGWRRTTACERASQAISLRLDGELTQLDARALERHLGRCPRCRRINDELAGFTALLRSAPPELPATHFVVASPRYAGAAAIRRLALVTAVAATMVSFASLISFSGPARFVGSSSALTFSSKQQQVAFARSKALKLEPVLYADAVAVGPAKPRGFWRRALL